MAAGDRNLDLGSVLILINNRSRIDITGNHRHLQHPPGFRTQRQERGIGRAAFRSEGRQDDVDDFVVFLQHSQQSGIELAGLVGDGRTFKFVIEPKGVKKTLETVIVVMTEAFMGPERIRDPG